MSIQNQALWVAKFTKKFQLLIRRWPHFHTAGKIDLEAHILRHLLRENARIMVSQIHFPCIFVKLQNGHVRHHGRRPAGDSPAASRLPVKLSTIDTNNLTKTLGAFGHIKRKTRKVQASNPYIEEPVPYLLREILPSYNGSSH